VLTAGFSKVCISPPLGAPLAGFAAREGVSQGIHDDLYARALILENAESAVAVVSVDVLALPSDFIARVRGEIQKSIGLPPKSVMIASTHTHAGPVTITTFFNPDESVDPVYMDALARAIQESVTTAWEGRFPARVGVGVGHVEGVGVNRRSPDQRPVDEEIGIIKVEDEGGTTRAVFMNYACHPTVLGPDNLLVSGDFPAFAVEEIEDGIGPNGFAMFVNGTQGNISMGHSSELSAIGVITPGRTFERAAELGHLLAEATRQTLSSIKVADKPYISAASIPIKLPLKNYPSLEQTNRSLLEAENHLARVVTNDGHHIEELRRAKSEHLYASITNFYAREARSLAGGLLPLELQGIRIDDAVFVAVPAEVFVEIGLQLKRIAPHRTFIVGIANGYIGYLPTTAAHADGGYEVVSSKCRPEAENILIEKVLKLEEKLFNGIAGSTS
jgi:Neutral/alkaline non-lysosomal ceramidase, N-terminal